MIKFRQRLQDFWGNENGSALAEAVIILPAVIWCYLAFFVYWDAFRTTNEAQKASYVLAELLSREQQELPETYAPGMLNLARYLLQDSVSTKLRVSSIVFSEGLDLQPDATDPDDETTVLWSVAPESGLAPLDVDMLEDFAQQVPIMYDGDSLVVVETWVQFAPLFDVGMPMKDIKNLVVARPRFLPKICMTGFDC